MKNEKNTATASAKSKTAKKTTTTKQRVATTDSTRVTEKVRSKPGHGLANEGTNVNYEEQR